MLKIEDAQLKIIEGTQKSSKYESLPLRQCVNRVLVKDVISNLNVPPADNSAMDGFALVACEAQNPATELPISQRISAGSEPKSHQSGTAARIFTGAEIPKGADCVVMQENCIILDQNHLRLQVKPKAGDNIRRCGQDITAGETLLKSGQRLQAQHLGLLASIGIAKLKVFQQIKVALLSTGNELIEPGIPLRPGQIYNSNQTMLAALLQTMGCEVTVQSVDDTFAATRLAIEKSTSQADLIISTGGVSVGEEDHVKEAVEVLGKLDMWKVNIKPGKPLAYGHAGETPFLGLPGNPVSAFVTFLLFATPLIKKLQGQSFDKPLSFFLSANFDITKPQSRPEYLRVKLANQCVERFPNQSSGVLASVCWADALALIPAHTTIRQGELVEVFPLDLFIR